MKFICQIFVSSVLFLGFTPGVFSQTQEEGEKDTGSPSEEIRMETYLGVHTSGVNDVLGQQLQIPDGVGLIIDKVLAGSPAEAAGIEEFDILLEMDGQIIVNRGQLTSLVRSKKPKDTVELEVVRKGEKHMFSVTLEEREVPPLRQSLQDFPYDMEDLTNFLKRAGKTAAEMGKKALQYTSEVVEKSKKEDAGANGPDE